MVHFFTIIVTLLSSGHSLTPISLVIQESGLSNSQLRRDELHPALKVSPTAAERIFKKGWEDAKRMRDPSRAWGLVRKGIGGIRVNAIGTKETVSCLWAIPPQLMIYTDAFDARKKYRTETDVAVMQTFHTSGAWEKADTISFRGHLTLLPSFGRGYGRIDRDATASDLDDVRVVLQVGEMIYQPRQHPGKLRAVQDVEVNKFALPASSSIYISSNSGSATATNYYTIYGQESYRRYDAWFDVEFDLFNPDGSSRISGNHDVITVIVVYGANERKATFRLADFERIGR